MISPIVVNDNLVDLTIGAGPQAGRADNGAGDAGDALCEVREQVDDWRARVTSQTSAGRRMSPIPTERTRSRSPARSRPDKPPILFSYAVPEPSRFAEVAFADALRAQGVTVNLATAAAQHRVSRHAGARTPRRTSSPSTCRRR